MQAMERLTQASHELEASYDRLRSEAQGLRAELGKKDRIISSLFSNLPLGVILVSADGVVEYGNAKAATFTACGNTLEALFGADIAAKVMGADVSEFRCRVDKGGGGWTLTAVSVADHSGMGERLILLEDLSQTAMHHELAERQRGMKTMVAAAAGVAHEIRNPLGSMELFASMLAPRLECDPEGKEMLEKIRSGLFNIDRIVSDFLLFASPPKPNLQDVPLKALLKEIGDFCAPIAAGDNVTFDVDVPDSLSALGDGRMLKQVFLNLALNAMQASSEGGMITVRAEKKDDGVLLEFRDTGSGIRAEDLGRIFDPFFTTKENGTGLGLSIVHDIIAAHGGKITAESSLGAGTALHIWLKGT